MRNPMQSLHRLMLLAAITFALVATGFSHRIPSPDDLALQVFAMSGGDLSDICADTDGDGNPDHGDCPACHIAGSADLPTAVSGVHDANLAFETAIVAPRESRAVRAVLNPAHGMRAPPLA